MERSLLVAFVSAIAACISALAAIIAPLISSAISGHNAFRIKATELYFEARVKAYEDFLKTASRFPLHPSPEQMQSLQAMSTSAMLFSSPETQEKIGRYGQLLMQPHQTAEQIQLLSEANRDMILFMQHELRDYHKYRHK